MTEIDLMYLIADKISQGSLGYDVCYCLEEGKFYIYTEGYWKQLDDIELTAMILRKYNGAKIDDKTSEINALKHTVARRKQILDNLRALVYKRLEVFNALGYLNFDVGEYDPIKDFWHPHDKRYYSTLRFNYEYDSHAECSLWLDTLDQIFEGSKDKKNILQEYFGYCLTRDTSQIKALLLLGESNSGKSTILEVLRHLLGIKNCSSVPMKFISNPQYTPLLMNKLVNIDADVSENAKDFEFEFKIIVRGEPISCNQKFVPTFEFKPYCKIVMAANTFPRITDHSSAFYNRLIIIPCDRVFLPKEQNRRLNIDLNKELSGVFNWAIEGLKRLNTRGCFSDVDFLQEAIADLRDESNPVDVFFRETIETDIVNKTWVEKGELYNKYIEWCKVNGNAPMSRIKFGKAVLQKYNRITEKNSQDFATGRLIWRNLKYKQNGAIAQPQENLQWQDS